MENISVIVAFTAGMLSFFSPCVFPLIPAYVSHLTGSTVQYNKIHVGIGMLIIRSIWFILGFSLVFVAMGASTSMIGQLFAGYRELIEKIGGFFIIVFGLQMARILNIRVLMFEKHWDHGFKKGAVEFVFIRASLRVGMVAMRRVCLIVHFTVG